MFVATFAYVAIKPYAWRNYSIFAAYASKYIKSVITFFRALVARLNIGCVVHYVYGCASDASLVKLPRVDEFYCLPIFNLNISVRNTCNIAASFVLV